MTRKQRVTRVVFSVFVVVVAAFVVSNVWQVARVVFGEPGATAGAQGTAAAMTVGDACTRAISEELRSIEMARQAATTELEVDAAKSRYSSERHKTAGARESTACTSDPHGTDALAAVARLDRASESHALRDVSELRPVRVAAQSFISGHPR